LRHRVSPLDTLQRQKPILNFKKGLVYQVVEMCMGKANITVEF